MFLYCKKCGLIRNSRNLNQKCDVCETDMSPVPSEYLTSTGLMFLCQEKRLEFEKVIKQNPDYDCQTAENKNRIINEKEKIRLANIEEKVQAYNQNKVKITCPVCHSEMLEKISNVGKVVKVGVFGILGAGDIGKKYKCNSCGHKF